MALLFLRHFARFLDVSKNIYIYLFMYLFIYLFTYNLWPYYFYGILQDFSMFKKKYIYLFMYLFIYLLITYDPIISKAFCKISRCLKKNIYLFIYLFIYL